MEYLKRKVANPFFHKLMKKIVLYSGALFLLIFSSCGDKMAKTTVVENPIEKLMAKNQEVILSEFKAKFINTLNDTITTISSVVKGIYKTPECLWSNGLHLNKSAESLLDLVSNAQSFGLDSSFYELSELRLLSNSLLSDTGNIDLLVKSEWQFTKTCTEFMTHIKYGYLNHDKSDSLYYQLKLDSLKSSEIAIISESIKGNRLAKAIDTLEPQFYAYKELRKSWVEFCKTKPLTKEKVQVETLKLDSNLAYKNAWKALTVQGYLDTIKDTTNLQKVDVLKIFQAENGLSEDGRIGRATAYALSRTNHDRWLSVMAVIEKMKWKPIIDDTLFYANIPAYSLKVIENNSIHREYRTVVGKTINRTPEFTAKMNYVILNPFWHLPNSISSKEVLPKLQTNSGIASKKGYRITDRSTGKVLDASKVDWGKVTQSSFNYKISQVRSGGTALGKVKFIFANKYSIYFHDTPSKRLFKNDIRAYSHGCVRVQNPLDLAQYILSRQDSVMTMDSVSNFTKRGIQKRINLTYNMPVYLRYYSCEGTSNVQMKFYRDIYKKETKVKMAIENLIAENQNKKTL